MKKLAIGSLFCLLFAAVIVLIMSYHFNVTNIITTGNDNQIVIISNNFGNETQNQNSNNDTSPQSDMADDTIKNMSNLGAICVIFGAGVTITTTITVKKKNSDER